MPSIHPLLTGVAVAMSACQGPFTVPCELDLHCDRGADGICYQNPATGNRWCSYPDPKCPRGYRYSDLDVGDGVSGGCTEGGPACLVDDECASGACFEGTCARPEAILYVSPAGLSSGECVADDPCDVAYALTRVDDVRSTIRLADGMYRITSDLVASSLRVTIVGGRRAVLQRPALGEPAMEVREGGQLTLRGMTFAKGVACASSAELSIVGVRFEGSSGDPYPWIDLESCASVAVLGAELLDSPGDGIRSLQGAASISILDTRIEKSARNGVALNGGLLAVARSMFRGNGQIGISATNAIVSIHRSQFFENRAGGISSVGGTFEVVNNIVVRNGNSTDAEFGGIRLDSTGTNNRVHHNTVFSNDCDINVMPPLAGGLYCRGGYAVNNLVVENFRGNTEQPNAQIGGTCNTSGSFINASSAAVHFRSLLDDFHLAGSSSAGIDAGVAWPELPMEDIDGQPRSDGMPDIGADEYAP